MRPLGSGVALGTALTMACLGLLAGCGGDAPPAQDSTDTSAAAEAPPGTDIWLASLSRDDAGALSLGEPENVTQRPGYDNQPAFLPDGSGFLYTVIDDAGQADIWAYRDDVAVQVTTSVPESEYSGTPLPDGSGFSAIRVEADSTQRLWRFDADGSNGAVILPDLAPVGYHTWVGDDLLVLFVLGDPATLQVARVSTGDHTVVAEDIGRSIQAIPGTAGVSYVQNLDGGGTEIRALNPATWTSTLIVNGVEGGDFHTWTPDGALLQAHEGRLFAFDPEMDTEWKQIADLSALGIHLSRLAVSPDGSRMALVAQTAP